MVREKVKVTNRTGLHLKPAGTLCNEAIKYKSSVTFQFGMTNVNAKSVLSVLAACVKSGDEIEFICDGPDEEEALAAMIRVIKSNFGEKEE
ncbi:MAG: HPr family phosphocarrier protein [Lachnospiraceae bacterium]|jgi:phosphocarrier protein HPr|nr:HPr family phosphocarrier protein [Lachnospiraceae bacterium]